MSINPVEGYGEITRANAVDIYRDRETYNKLSDAQRHLVDKYVPQETRDEIDYELRDIDSYNNGKEQINTEGTEDGKKTSVSSGASAAAIGAAGGAAAAGVFNVAAQGFTNLSGMMSAGAQGFESIGLKAPAEMFQKQASALAKKGAVNGFVSIICAGLTVAGAAAALVMSFKNVFDPGYEDRENSSNESGTTDETLQSYSDALLESMELMDESTETYAGQVEEFTEITNNNNSRDAELTIEIADAEAMGDFEKVKELKKELIELSKFDYSEMEEGMDETRGELEEYGMMAEESQGVADSGTSVSEFLKAGKVLNVMGIISGSILAATSVLIATSSLFNAIPKLHTAFGPIDGIPAAASKAIWLSAAAMMGVASGMMISNASKEKEFSDNGETMSEYVDTLNTTIEDQVGYTEKTTADFEEIDEDSEKSIEKGEENASKAVEKADNNRSKSNNPFSNYAAMNNGATFVNSGNNGSSNSGGGNSSGGGSNQSSHS